MANYNKVILIGNLTRDPELRYASSGTAIAKIAMAINRTWRDANGELKEDVTFVDVDAFGKQAETLGKHMKKGRPIMVEGRLKLDTWEDKQTNQKRSRLGVVLESFQFLDFRSSEEGGGAPRPPRSTGAAAAPAAAQAPAPANPPADAEEPPHTEDDVPF
jgi:single-strand DNA-binding protein